MKKDRHPFYVLISVCGLIAASIGVTIHCNGVFYAPIAEDLGVGRGSVSMTSTIMSIVGAVISLRMAKIANDHNIKGIILLAVLLMIGGTAGMAFVHSLGLMYVLSVIRGIGAGMTNLVLATYLLNHWFYSKRGLVTSIAMAFTGVPGVFLPNIYSSIISSSGWQAGEIAVAVSILIFCLPAVILPVSVTPEAMHTKPYGYDEYMQAKAEGKIQSVSPGSGTGINKTALVLITVYVCLVSCVAAIPQHFPGYAESIAMSAGVGALMLSASMACNILSKVVYGIISDKMSNLKCICLMAAAAVLGCVMLIFVHQPAVLVIGAGLFTFTFTLSSVAYSIGVTDIFGMENYGTVYAFLSLVGGLTMAAGSTIVGVVYDVTGSYVPDFLAMIVMEAIAVVCVSAAYRIASKEKKA